MTLAVDTNILVELLRGSGGLYRERLNQTRAAQNPVCISSLVLHELLVGGLRSGCPQYHLDRIGDLAAAFDVDPWTAEDAFMAARVRADLDRAGQPIGLVDGLIAGHALRREAVLVTRNLRHFFRPGTVLDQLRLIDWTISDQPLDRPALIASLRRPQEE